MGNLTEGTEVVYTLFEDQTGVILSRMDGNWKAPYRDQLKQQEKSRCQIWKQTRSPALTVMSMEE